VYPDSRNPFTFTELLDEGLEAWTVEELWVMGTAPGAQEAFVDITEVFDRKLKALLCHVSQMTEPDAMEGRLREWNGANAVAGGLGAGRLAERFAVMHTV
jgi:LmbE family N-acetylglucosaminyl deacetylase